MSSHCALTLGDGQPASLGGGCLVEALGGRCSWNDGGGVLHMAPVTHDGTGFEVVHPDHCPAPDGPAAAAAPVRVAASVLVVSSDGYALVTQRPAAMRTFPNAWVIPGGGVDGG